MATINLGNLTFTHKGDYAGGTAYVKNDVVYYATNGNSYIAKTSTTGNAPTSTSHWDLFVAGASGIWNAGLSLGSAGQAVKVNTAGNALEFGTISSKVGQVLQTVLQGSQSVNGHGSFTDYTNVKIDITPTATSSKIWVGFNGFVSNDNWSTLRLRRKIGSGSVADVSAAHGTASGSRQSSLPVHCYSYSDNNQCRNFNVWYLDSPNTTDQVTYNLAGMSYGSNSIFIGRTYSDANYNAISRGSTFINAWEILA